MFAGWQTFYQMTGEAAATLTGLLFIVASLTSGRNSGHERGVMLFTSPTAFHFASVLAVSALALAPDGEQFRAVLMFAWAALSLAYTAWLAIQLYGIDEPSHWTDFWWYGAAPVALYLTLAGATVSAYAHVGHAAYFVALCLMMLLLVTIRNAWDLVTWLAPRRD